MELIRDQWLVWLIAMIACYGLTFILQIIKMRSMTSDFNSTTGFGRFEEGQKKMFKGVIPMMILGLAGSAAGILLLISVIIHLVEYFTK